MNQEQRLNQLLKRTEWGVAAISEVAQLSTTRQIKFEAGSCFEPESLQPLAKLRRLQWLHFKASHLSGEHLQSLAQIPLLRRLDLCNCDVSDDEAPYLELFDALPHFNELWLEGTAISDAALPFISKISRLEWLILGHTQITDEGLNHVQQLTHLKTLWVNETAVSDAGLMRLSVLPRLSGVGIYNSRATVVGLDALFNAQIENAKTTSFIDEKEYDAAKQILLSFQQAMSEWETTAYQQYQQIEQKYREQRPQFNVTTPEEASESQQVWEEARQKLRAIFETYCTPKQRVYGGPEHFSLGQPPQYDWQEERILNREQPSPRKMIFYVSSPTWGKLKFVLHKKGGKWLIDSKQRWDGGWAFDLL